MADRSNVTREAKKGAKARFAELREEMVPLGIVPMLVVGRDFYDQTGKRPILFAALRNRKEVIATLRGLADRLEMEAGDGK